MTNRITLRHVEQMESTDADNAVVLVASTGEFSSNLLPPNDDRIRAAQARWVDGTLQIRTARTEIVIPNTDYLVGAALALGERIEFYVVDGDRRARACWHLRAWQPEMAVA